MTEQEARNLVLLNGKRDCVYADDFCKLIRDLGKLGKHKYLELRDYCKRQGMQDVREWLISQNLYRNVERDMRGGEGMIRMEDEIEVICGHIFDKYPLVGEPVLSEPVLARLFARAQVIFDGIVENGGADLTEGDRDVITLAIVQFIQRRNLQEGGKSDGQFWPYIYTQFGYKQDNDETNTQAIYNALRAAVRGAFLKHDRFFSSEKDTQQYYTSLRLHALTPVQSMESLFEILRFFYVNDLEFNYVPEDPIFASLVNCIASRWEKDVELQRELNVRSNAMASGLKALFKERPAFMRGYCEQIVRRLDALARGVDVLRPESTLDGLLRQWYARNHVALTAQAAGQTAGRSASSVESIRLRYVLENRRVCLSVPPIRLEDQGDTPLVMTLYQGDNAILSREMEVFGRLSRTTREMLIPLDDTGLDSAAPLRLEACITCGDQTLLARDTRLHRAFIVFNENGREVSPQTQTPGFYYLYASESARIAWGTMDPEWIDGGGQLMRLYVDGDSAVYIDGTELFVSGDRQGDVRCYPSLQRVSGLRGRREGEIVNLYPAAVSLDLRLPAGARSLNYQLIIDGRVEPLSKYCLDGETAFVLNGPTEAVRRHSIRMVEWSTERVVWFTDYAILPGLRWETDRELVFDDGAPVTARVHYDGCDIVSREHPAEDTDWVALSAGHLEYELEARLPMVRGTLLNQNLFALPSLIWREKLLDSAFVKVQCPSDWSVRLFLGASAVPQNSVDGSFELGNTIRARHSREKTEALTLVMKNARGHQDFRTLTHIAFEAHFTESPVSIENGELVWRPEGRYVGGDGDEFRLEVSVEEGTLSYALDAKGAVVDRNFGRDYPCGDYPFRIIRKKRSLFGASGDQVLLEGALAVGAPEQRRVMGKYLYLTRARCWDGSVSRMVNLDMPEGAGCLCNLQFQGFSTPSGESLEYPEYTGELYFYNPSAGSWQYFNDQEKPGFEWINPVRVWLISEQIMILRTAEAEAPYIDREYSTIVNRTLNLPKHVQNCRLILPDYFEYRTEQDDH